jgi:hypothetical protein
VGLLPSLTAAPASVSEPEPVTSARVKSIEAGASKAVVISRLGNPAATILIPDSGGLRQVLYYTKDGDMLGSVDLNPDGAVTEVRVKN